MLSVFVLTSRSQDIKSSWDQTTVKVWAYVVHKGYSFLKLVFVVRRILNTQTQKSLRPCWTKNDQVSLFIPLFLLQFEDGIKQVYDGDNTNFEKLLEFVEKETVPIVYKHDLIEVRCRLCFTQTLYRENEILEPLTNHSKMSIELISFKRLKSKQMAVHILTGQ